MTPHQQKLLDLVRGLWRRTTSGKAEWRAGPDGRSAHTTMKTGKIEIKWDKDDSGQDAVRLSVYDTIGELKISFDDTALQYYDSESENLIGHFTEMRDLLEAAVRVGRGEEQVLNSLLDELGDDVPF